MSPDVWAQTRLSLRLGSPCSVVRSRNGDSEWWWPPLLRGLTTKFALRGPGMGVKSGLLGSSRDGAAPVTAGVCALA